MHYPDRRDDELEEIRTAIDKLNVEAVEQRRHLAYLTSRLIVESVVSNVLLVKETNGVNDWRELVGATAEVVDRLLSQMSSKEVPEEVDAAKQAELKRIAADKFDRIFESLLFNEPPSRVALLDASRLTVSPAISARAV